MTATENGEDLPVVVEAPDNTLSYLESSEVVERVQHIHRVQQAVMKDKTHYGVIPGCGKKPALFKAGAEILMVTFQLSAEYYVEKTVMSDTHREYDVIATLTHIPTGRHVGQGVGSCSTMENKYRYRTEWDRGQKTRVENESIPDTWNTVLKMAKKRALVDAVLTAVSASEVFTQDVEDFERPPAEPKGPASVRSKINKPKPPPPKPPAPQPPAESTEQRLDKFHQLVAIPQPIGLAGILEAIDLMDRADQLANEGLLDHISYLNDDDKREARRAAKARIAAIEGDGQ